MTDTASILAPQRALPGDALAPLRDAAHTAANWDVVHRPVTAGSFGERVHAARRSLKSLEMQLASVPITPPQGNPRRIAYNGVLLELRTNSRLLRTAITAVSTKPKDVARLPRVVLPAQKDEPRIATAAGLYLRTVHGDFSPLTFQAFIRTLQEHEPLTVGELWDIAAFLKFALLELILEAAPNLLHSPDSADVPLFSVRLKSLKSLGYTDWVYFIEPLIVFDAALRQDPAATYDRMDFESREFYRKRIAKVARHSDVSESQVAQIALDLARQAEHQASDDPRMHTRRMHIGYYLIDKGFPQLAARIGYHPPLIYRTRALVRAHADDFYITGIELLTLLSLPRPFFRYFPTPPVS